MKVRCRKSLRKREPGTVLTAPIAEPRLIHRHAQRLCAACFNSCYEFPVETAIALPIQKEPNWRCTCSHTFLDAGGPGGTVNENRRGISCTPRSRYLSLRMHHALESRCS